MQTNIRKLTKISVAFLFLITIVFVSLPEQAKSEDVNHLNLSKSFVSNL